MAALRTVAIFAFAAFAELAGTYAVWRWLRAGSTVIMAAVGIGALFAYAVVQTYQAEPRYGRVYAAYAGVFLIGAMLWGWLVDGKRPDLFDWFGAGLVLLGVLTIMWGRTLLGSN